MLALRRPRPARHDVLQHGGLHAIEVEVDNAHKEKKTMTINEFKAWLEGFEEGMKGAPTKAQWTKVKERLGQVCDAVPAVPHYVDPYPVWWPYHWQWTPYTTGTGGTWSWEGNGVTCSIHASTTLTDAAYQIGKLEYVELTDSVG